jgi:hypothetical protein
MTKRRWWFFSPNPSKVEVAAFWVAIAAGLTGICIAIWGTGRQSFIAGIVTVTAVIVFVAISSAATIKARSRAGSNSR